MQDAHETAATTPDRILRGLLNILSLVALLYIFLAAIAMFGVAFKLMGKEVSEN
ncbi:hypothetical protein GW813_08990, partial [bacterium]|nr:hypothetical protein [bacterium]